MLAASIQVEVGTLQLDVSLDVADGELLAVLGPNGSGKSTLLRCLAGLLPIDSGQIVVDDVVYDAPQSRVFVEPNRRSTSVVLQQHSLFEHMSLLENVAFGIRAGGGTRQQARTRASEWLEQFGLGSYAGSRPSVLSGGQAQRVALARALATRPRLLMMDEPLAALDSSTRSEVRRDLRRYLTSFSGMRILVTHDPVDAYALADRVLIIESGRVVQSGTLPDLAARPRSRYVADLVGLNLFTGVVSGGVLITATGAAIVIADAPDGMSYATIRPHSISVLRQPDAASSPRNCWPGVVTDLDRLGDRVRVALAGPVTVTAEITLAANDALQLAPGDSVWAAVKATDIEVYAA